MTGTRFEKLSAATGYAALLCGIGAVALERPWPSTTNPAALPVFLADNHAAILGQSLLFLLSAGFSLWFLGSLRSHLLAREAGTGRVTMIAFTAGMIGYGLTVVGQAPQITLTLPAQASVDPALAALLTDPDTSCCWSRTSRSPSCSPRSPSCRSGTLRSRRGWDGSPRWPRWPPWSCRSRSSIPPGRWHPRGGSATCCTWHPSCG